MKTKKPGVLFLDIDGTVRKPLSNNPFILNPEDQQIIEGAHESARYYYENGWDLIGITNQEGVKAGRKSLEDCIKEHHVTLKLLPYLNAIYFCPDYVGLECWRITWDIPKGQTCIKQATQNTYGSFRKPGCGMVKLALKDFDYEYEQKWFIGDREEAKLCALASKIKYMRADIWRSRFLPGVQTHNLLGSGISKTTLLEFLNT